MNDTLQMTPVPSDTLAVLNKSEIDQQITTAKRYPRSLKQFRDDVREMATIDERTAESCRYKLPRGGKTIEGPSARFAEIVASAWGNCRWGSRVIELGDRFVTAQGVFHDLQSNSFVTVEVQRRITDKNGFRYNDDMIGVTANAACSIALRNAVFKGVPQAFWLSMYDEAMKVALGSEATLSTRRNDAMSYLKTQGVQPSQACSALGVKGVEDIGLEELFTLKCMIQAVRDGDTTIEQTFFGAGDEGNDGPKQASQTAERVKNSNKKAQSKQKTPPGETAVRT